MSLTRLSCCHIDKHIGYVLCTLPRVKKVGASAASRGRGWSRSAGSSSTTVPAAARWNSIPPPLRPSSERRAGIDTRGSARAADISSLWGVRDR
eukprot:scaffold631949_cov19-Prasinocladus_malaysianus.AAC.2